MGTKNFSNANDLITFSRASAGTYLDSDGVLKLASSDIPRIEYDADGNVLGLLVEESRTNLVEPSEDITDVWWSYTLNVTKTADQAVAPDGRETADKVVATSTNATHMAGTAIAYSSGASNETFSFYVKPAGITNIKVLLANQTGDYTQRFDLTAGTPGTSGVGTLDKSIQDVGNGWYRCSMTYTATKTNPYPSVQLLDSGGSETFAGNDSDGIYLWGAQIEVGDFPTSYIPTAGATATRSADVASIPVADFGFNQSVGSVVVEGQTTVSDSNTRFFSLSDGTTNNRIAFSRGFIYHPYVATGGVAQASLDAGTVNTGTLVKVATSFKQDDISSVIDGGSVATDTSATIPSVNKLYLAAGATGSINGACHIKSIRYYPRRLTNAQLQELTT